ncbi:MAG: hypothetical protein KC613_27435, partial [Myxococcales bacterium]|nr:hypothetical protein [Myxococcales bacterium]
FGPLFAGIPSIVDQVVSLIEEHDQQIIVRAGLGPMKGAVCQLEDGAGRKHFTTGEQARADCHAPLHPEDPWVLQ